MIAQGLDLVPQPGVVRYDGAGVTKSAKVFPWVKAEAAGIAHAACLSTNFHLRFSLKPLPQLSRLNGHALADKPLTRCLVPLPISCSLLPFDE
jgi:hypothetical protein